jgi:hypothetical protein
VAEGPDLPRIEDFQTDLDSAAVATAEARYLRATAMQGYLLAFPAFLHMRQLTEYLQGRRYMAPGEAPLGGWFLMRRLSDPTVTTVSPNVDTLYGASHLLLDRQGPVVLQVPAIADRYYSVVCMDAYWDNFGIVSPRTYGTDGGEFLLVPPGWEGAAPDGIRAVIEAPTPSIVLLQRIYVRDPAEVEGLHSVQDAIRLLPLAKRRAADTRFDEVDLTGLDVQAMRATRDPVQFFRYTNWYTGWNPPTGTEAGIGAMLGLGGVGPGAAVPEAAAAQAAIRAGASDAQAFINARLTEGPVRNGWRVPDPRSGHSGAFIGERAVIQATAMGAFVNEEAMYFFAYRDDAGALLDGRAAYTLTFGPGELPPLIDPGFWSLTMYNESAFLVDNAIRRYAIRPDTPGLAHEPDGGLVLHLGATKPVGAPDGNWLPAPEGPFNVALRTYLPKADVVAGRWFPPPIAHTGA